MKEFNLEEYLKNPSQKVVTRDGREVRIICTDAKGDEPIVALLYNKNRDEENVYTYNKDGIFYENNTSCLDLFFVPTKREGWVNIYRSHRCSKRDRIAGDFFPSEKEAKESQIYGYITTIKIEWEE